MDINKGCDTCKPFREGFAKMTAAIASSKIFTAVFTAIPILSMIVALIYFETSFNIINFNNVDYEVSRYKYVILSPVIVVSSLTIIFGVAALLAIRFEFQNVLGFSSFVYAAIAYWGMINILIIVFCMIPYFSGSLIGSILAWSSFSAAIWLFSSAVMDAHRKNVNSLLAEDPLSHSLHEVMV
jgi:hypothetical protein